MKIAIAALLAAASLGGCVAVPYYAPAPRAYVAPPPPPVVYYGYPAYRYRYYR
jgi:hypothetical protein